MRTLPRMTAIMPVSIMRGRAIKRKSSLSLKSSPKAMRKFLVQEIELEIELEMELEIELEMELEMVFIGCDSICGFFLCGVILLADVASKNL